MRRVFTIGYEGASLADFVATLDLAGIDTLLDVREIPISRRPGFSKSALSDALSAAGVAYRHEKRLGSPAAIRHRLREDGDYSAFFRDFRRYLKTQAALITQLAADLSGNVALMCYERDPQTCHRLVVAEAFETLIERESKHLGVKHDAARQKSKTPQPRRGRVGQGLSAAWRRRSSRQRELFG